MSLHSYHLTRQVQNFVSTQALTDVTIYARTNDSDEANLTMLSLRAHKIVLASASKLLKNIFLDMNESMEDVTIVIPDMKISDLTLVLNLVYTGFQRLKSRGELDQILENLALLDMTEFQDQGLECCLLSNISSTPPTSPQQHSLHRNLTFTLNLPQIRRISTSSSSLPTTSASSLSESRESNSSITIIPSHRHSNLTEQNDSAISTVTTINNDVNKTSSPIEVTPVTTLNASVATEEISLRTECQPPQTTPSPPPSIHSLGNKFDVFDVPTMDIITTDGDVVPVHEEELHKIENDEHDDPLDQDNDLMAGMTKCPECELLLPEDSVEKHVRQLHQANQIFNCEFCGKEYKRDSELRAHRRIHTGERPFTCNICGRSFGFKHILKRHKLFHSGERPFKCSVCSQGFAQKIDLDKHSRIHTGELPYRCSICNRAFRRIDYLRKHRNVHVKNKKSSVVSIPNLEQENKIVQAWLENHLKEQDETLS